MNTARAVRRTSVFLALLLGLVVEDVLEPLVDDDLVLVLLDAPEAGVCPETGETGIGHGGGREQTASLSQSARAARKFWGVTRCDSCK